MSNTPPPRKAKGHAFFAPLYSNDTSGDLDDSPPSSRNPTTDQEEKHYREQRPYRAVNEDEEFDSFGDYPAPSGDRSELESFSSPQRPTKGRKTMRDGGDDARQQPSFLRGLSSIGAPMARGFSRSASKAVSTIGRSMSLMGEHIVDIVGPVERGVFDDWSRKEIVHVLVEDNIEVRDALTIPLNVLREEAHLFYLDRPIPPKPLPEDLRGEQSVKAAEAAGRIQNIWVNAKAKKTNRPAKRVEAGPSPVYTRAESAMQMIPEPEDPVHDDKMRRGFLETANSYIYEGEDRNTPLDENGKPVQQFALNEPWIPPSVEFAKEYANKNHPRQKVRSHKGAVESKKYNVLRTTTGRFCQLGGLGEQCDLWEEGQASELGQFGPGITVYFKFVKFCFWMFVTLSFLYIIPLVGNKYGGYYSDTDAVTDLALGTLGNLGGFSANNTEFALLISNCNVDWRGKDCEVSRAKTAMMYSSVTFTGCVLMLIGYMWLRLFEAREEIMLDKNTVQASDYSVKVQNLPTRCSEAELRAHFVRILDEHGETQAVEDCTIAYDNEHEIEVYKKRGDLVKRRYRATQEYRYYKTLQITKEAPVTEEQLEKIAELRQRLTKEIHALDDSLKEYEEERKKHKGVPICAYLTFQNTLGAQMALRLYGKSWLGYLFMRHKLRFKGKRLVVSRAPEPSTIIWENLRYTYRERWSRRFGTAVISILLLAVSAIASYAPRAIGETTDNAGGNDPCPDGFDELSQEEQRDYVEDHKGTMHCYCDELSFYTQANDPTCGKYFKTQLYTQLILLGAAIMVLMVNALIDFSIRLCAQYEKHHSVDSLEQGIFIRMYITKLINMGILFLFGNHITVLGSLFGVSLPQRNTFSHDWFFTVGVNILLVEIGNIFTIHVMKIMRFVHSRYRQAKARKDCLIALTQDELNTLYLGPEFLISHRYAQVMADFTVCLMFASGMPALVFIGMANFYVAYWVDKFLFLRFYRTPPRYSLQIGSLAASIIPFAICAHVVVAIWAFGVSEELQTSQENVKDYEQRVSPYDALDLKGILTQRHIIPLLALFVAMAVLITMNIAVDAVFGGIQKLVKGIFGGLLSKYEYYNELERYFNSNVQISYSRAKQRGIIKGLVNYNILQNPIYKDAFAVDDNFAGKHRSLTSIQKATELSYYGEDKVHSFMSEGGAAPRAPNKAESDPRIMALLDHVESVELGRGSSHMTSDTDGEVVAVSKLGDLNKKASKKNLTVVADTAVSGSPGRSPHRSPMKSASPHHSPAANSPLVASGSKQRGGKAFFADADDKKPHASPKVPVGPSFKDSPASSEKPRRRRSETNSADATLTEAALVALAAAAAERDRDQGRSSEKKEPKKRRHSVNARVEGGGGGLSPSEMQYLASLQKSHLSPMVSPRIPLSPRTELPAAFPHGGIEAAVQSRHGGDKPSSRLEREEPLSGYNSRTASPMVSPRVDPGVRYGDMSPRRNEDVISAPRRNSDRRGLTPRGRDDDDVVSAPRRDSDRRMGSSTPRESSRGREEEPRRRSSAAGSSTPRSHTPRGRDDDDVVSAPRRDSDRRMGSSTPRESSRGREEEPRRRSSAAGSSTPRDSSTTPDRKSVRRSSATAAVPAALPSPRRKEESKPPAPLSYEDIIRSYEHIDTEAEKPAPRPAPIAPLTLGIAAGHPSSRVASPRGAEHYPTRVPSPRGGHHHRHHDDGDQDEDGERRFRLGGGDMLEESSSSRPSSARRR